MAFGVFAGASIAVKVPASTPATPASFMVGPSGTSGERFTAFTANARTLPALTWPMAEEIWHRIEEEAAQPRESKP